MIPARRERALLASLLLHANRTVTVERIVDAVWGERRPRNPTGQVYSCVYRLRKQLAAAGLPGSMIAKDPTGYRILVQPPDLDLAQFRQLRDQASTVRADRPEEAAALLRAALDLWRGPALDGMDSRPLRDAAAALDEEHLQAREAYIQIELELGRGEGRIADLTELVRQHPYREGLHGKLMLALYQTGRQADALATFRNLRQALHDQLGTEPGAELQRLHKAILNRDPALEHRSSRSLREPTAIVAGTPRELPADVSGFTGREKELAQLDELLAMGGHGQPGPMVISAVAGTAGVGKTALAVHWAHRVADRFPDGQLFLNLRGYASSSPLRPVEALSAMLRSLGTPPEEVPTDEAQAAALYRTKLATQRVLILLDNARTVDQIRPLLPGSPGCLVLVTSRDRLAGLVARDGATPVRLDVLRPEEACDLLVKVLGAERAGTEPEPVSRLAALCGYLPLAVRIAAAHLVAHPDQSIAGYVSGLATGDRIRALRAAGDEEHAVLATFDRSYQSFASQPRRLFRLLGMVPGPDLTAAAAAALTGTAVADAAAQLRQLASGHLVVELAPGRYGLHDLLREYARQLAGEHERPADRAVAIERLLHAYLRTAESATDQLSPRTFRLPDPAAEPVAELVELSGASAALRWLDQELPNLVAAIEYAADHGPDPLVGPLLECVRHYSWHRRCIVEWRAAATAARRAAERTGDGHTLAVAHLSLADASFNLASYLDAAEHYQTVIATCQQLRWTPAEAVAHAGLATTYRDLGQLSAAAEEHARASELNHRSGTVGAEVTNLSNLAGADRDAGRLWQARDRLLQALGLSRKLGSTAFEAGILNNLGMIEHELGRLGSAAEYLLRALKLHQQHSERNGTSIALDSLAAVYRDAGRFTEARDRAEAGLAITVELGNLADQAFAYHTLGSIHLGLGHLETAVQHHQRALSLADQTGIHEARILALIGLADSRGQLGEAARAVGSAREALVLARELGFRALAGQAATSLSELLLRYRHPLLAAGPAGLALAHHRETGHRLGEARTLAVLGHIARATGQPEAAHRHWRDALALFADIGAPAPEEVRTVDAMAAGPD